MQSLNDKPGHVGRKKSQIRIKAARLLVFTRECVRNLNLGVHPGDLWVSKHWVHVVLEASKSAGAKGDVP